MTDDVRIYMRYLLDHLTDEQLQDECNRLRKLGKLKSIVNLTDH